MKAGNYKIIKDRLLSPTEIAKGMDFEQALKRSIRIKSSFLGKNIFAGVLIISSILLTFFLINRTTSKKLVVGKMKSDVKKKAPINSVEKETKQLGEVKIRPNKFTKDTARAVEIKQEMENDNELPEIVDNEKVRIVPFKIRGYADAESAITIKDSIYGPTNVSMGRGDLCEYMDPKNPKATEKNSAWFKFTIKKDTLLTFHIVPTLKTDDYDFTLFKCDNYTCLSEIKQGKLKPVRYCFSWNTTVNINTGLSNKHKDTTFQAWEHIDRSKYGKTYSSALHVKAGETYYLMVNISNTETQNKEPEGFMIYFYNYLPKAKANTYKYPKNVFNQPKE